MENANRRRVGVVKAIALDAAVPLTDLDQLTRPMGPKLESRGISVQVTDAASFAAAASQWRDLVARTAEPNVFQEPSFVAAASGAAGGSDRTLLAWQNQGQERSLVGAWTMRVASPRSRLPVRVLSAPLLPDYALLATPVLDRDLVPEALSAMLDAITADDSLPKIVLLRMAVSSGPFIEALYHLLAARKALPVEMDRRQRAKLRSGLDGPTYFERALSASTRKKLRQHRRRLAQQGAVSTISHIGVVDGVAAFERFLELEFASWKGRAGTAVLCRADKAVFAREAFRRMAAEGCAWVEALHVGDRVVSAQVMMRSGRAAFTWKIAHDEAFAEFSPGILLVEDYSAKLLADGGLDFADSCSFNEQSFMSDLWKERQEVVEVCFDVRPGGSLAFQAVAAADRLYVSAREQAKRLKNAWEAKQAARARARRAQGANA